MGCNSDCQTKRFWKEVYQGALFYLVSTDTLFVAFCPKCNSVPANNDSTHMVFQSAEAFLFSRQHNKEEEEA